MQVHLTRMAFANATRPLLRSILMDHVAKRHRGKINALESVRAMSWSGSAALGGYVELDHGTSGLARNSNLTAAEPRSRFQLEAAHSRVDAVRLTSVCIDNGMLALTDQPHCCTRAGC